MVADKTATKIIKLVLQWPLETAESGWMWFTTYTKDSSTFDSTVTTLTQYAPLWL